MPTDKKLKQLIINKLTKEQFDSATVSPDEQYFITDDDYFATKNELAIKQNITDNNLVTTNKTVVGAVNELDSKIKEIQLYKTPNVLIQGEPTINNGQVTGFSKTNYLILPFEFNVGDRGFELTYAFRTGSDVTTPQNLFGSKFSIASYIQNSKLTIRISSNGTSWDVLDLITSLDIQPNTTYYIKLIFNKLSYEVKSSADGVEYSQIGRIVDTRPPFAGDVYIGIGNNTNNPFLGMINLHKWELKYNNSVFWEGMDDAGLATRADISLSNLDEQGEAKFDAKQDLLTPDNAGKNIIITTGSVIPIIPLPDGYTQREFVGNNGTQWIDTGIAVNTLTNPTIETTFRMDEQADADWFGTQNANSPTIIYNFKNGTASALYFRWGTTINIASSLTLESGKSLNDFDFSNKMSKLKIDNNNGTPKYYVNDELVATQRTTPVFTNEQTICISRGRGSAKASWQSFKISDNGVDLFDGVPCTRDSDGKGGMYDLITNKFIPSSGGELIVGDIVAEGLKISADLSSKQDIISDLSTIRSNAQTGAKLAPQVSVNTQRIEDLTTARIPDVIYHGTPKITGGQISDFSTTNYLQFPFTDISRGLPFDIYFSFTTDSDVTIQQNIIDSRFGIALAIQNGKGVMALSSDGISWDIGSSTGTNTLLPNTTYYVKYSWTGTEYNASLSTNDQSYVPDMILQSNKSPYKTTIYIGGCDQEKTGHTPHPFKGIINFSKSKVVVNGNTVWEGMADVGISSRANVSLTNLDEVGEARFTNKLDKPTYIEETETLKFGGNN